MVATAPYRWPAPILLAAATAIATCCGTVDGTDPYALWRTYQDPGHAYHFHYPSPPWIEAAEGTPGLPILEIDPDDDPLAELPAARLRLEARAYFSADIEDVVASETAAWQLLGYSTSPPQELVSAAGDAGVLLAARHEDVSVQQVFQEQGGTVVTLFVWGEIADVGDRDVELLLESFEPRGAGED